MNKEKWMIVVAIVSLTGVVSADNYRWNNFSGSAGNWNDPTNWILTDGTYNGQVPGSGDRAYTAGDPCDWANVTVLPTDTGDIWGYDMGSTDNAGLMITQASSYYNWTPQIININAEDNITLSRWRGGNGGHLSNVTVNIYGNLTATSSIEVERSHYGAVEMNQYAGSTVNVQNFEIGYKSYRAIYNMYGGSMTADSITIPSSQSGYAIPNNVGAYPTADHDQCYTLSKAELNIYDGDIYTNALNLNYLSYPSGKINILDGTLYVLNDVRYLLDYLYIPNNAILPIDPQDHIYSYFDGTYTVITAVPEPATMALIGFGSLLFLRRRKNK